MPVTCRIDTPIEIDYYQHGGIMPYVLRQLLAGSRAPAPHTAPCERLFPQAGRTGDPRGGPRAPRRRGAARVLKAEREMAPEQRTRSAGGVLPISDGAAGWSRPEPLQGEVERAS